MSLKSTILTFIIIFAFQNTFGESNTVELKFKKAGLVDVNTIDTSIQVSLVNSNPANNFFRENYYQGLNKAYFRDVVAIKLAKAQKILQSSHPDYSLLVLDAARPRNISQKMYDKMKGTKFERYVANPEKGSMHNYGIAVDITIADKSGKKIDMGFTPFFKSDFQIYYQFIKMKIGFDSSNEQKKNRKLLSDVMKKAGFFPLSFEWWHFNGMKKSEARAKYQIIE
jgi:D-alanyl-D-alanine dipeptidase